MDINSKALYTKEVEKKIFNLYQFNGEYIEILDGFENFVYLYNDPNTPLVLRVSHSLRRSVEEIRGELEFLHYLRAENLNVTEPQRSPRGNWLESVPVEGGYYTAVCFKRAPGGEPHGEEWNETLYYNMGVLQAKLHNAARQFPGLTSAARRPIWERELQNSLELYLPKEQPLVARRLRELMQTFNKLPRNKEDYGLCHLDFHGGNFFTHRGEITLFDFDDCQEFWFAGDMAVTLFYMLIPWDGGEMDPGWGRQFFQEFLKGYRSCGAVNEKLLAQVPEFLTLREIDLYLCILRSFPQWEKGPEDVQNFMKSRRERIESGRPLLELNQLLLN